MLLASYLPLPEKLPRAVDVERDLLAWNPFLPGNLVAEFQYRPGHLREVLGRVISFSEVQRTVFGKLQHQLDAEAEAGQLSPTRTEDLIVALIVQLVFPFAAAPMLQVGLGIDAAAYRAMMARRRTDLIPA